MFAGCWAQFSCLVSSVPTAGRNNPPMPSRHTVVSLGGQHCGVLKLSMMSEVGRSVGRRSVVEEIRVVSIVDCGEDGWGCCLSPAGVLGPAREPATQQKPGETVHSRDIRKTREVASIASACLA